MVTFTTQINKGYLQTAWWHPLACLAWNVSFIIKSTLNLTHILFISHAVRIRSHNILCLMPSVSCSQQPLGIAASSLPSMIQLTESIMACGRWKQLVHWCYKVRGLFSSQAIHNNRESHEKITQRHKLDTEVLREVMKMTRTLQTLTDKLSRDHNHIFEEQQPGLRNR